jgi:uncharacterized protein (DUF1800 family)
MIDYLPVKTTALTAAEAAHLLRRATMGPTKAEITAFTGVSSDLAIQTLINNINYLPAPPVDLNDTKTTVGQPYVNTPYDSVANRNFEFRTYYRHWWINMMAAQGGNPSIVDKLTLFWQNHFVTTSPAVDEFRAVYQYFNLIRNGVVVNNMQRGGVLGNFRDMVYQITLNPAMLKYLNGHDSIKGTPNENYARELQELFVVGGKDFAGNNTYTENDVKAAARLLTGWRHRNFYTNGTTFVESYFTLSRHDTTSKQFSLSYPDPQNPTLGTVINTPTTTPVGYNNVGEFELEALLDMLFRHPHTAKFICRKLYRFFVNPNVTQVIEDTIIDQLATMFKTPDPTTGRTFEVKPIIVKLLSSQHFYDVTNIGAMIKSPFEFAIGTYRFFGFNVPTIDNSNSTTLANTIKNHRQYASYLYERMNEMQMTVLDQPSVFGYVAYYQTGYSRNWINTTQVGLRNSFTDKLLTGYNVVSGNTPLITIKINVLALPDQATNPYDCYSVFDFIVKNMFATPFTAAQRTFLVETIMMNLQPLSNWNLQWTAYKQPSPSTTTINTVKSKLDALLKYLFRMAEYHIC